jgi:RNA methyltransferase, TrmH family
MAGRRMHPSLPPAVSIPRVLQRIIALRQRRARDAQGCFWIEGIRNFVQAFDARLSFDTIVHSHVLLKSDCAEMLSRRAAATGVPRLRVSPEQFRSVSTAPRASGIGAIVRQQWTPLEQLRHDRGTCFLVLESIRSPGNLGTILRTAEAAGGGGILFIGPQCDPFDPATVRASMSGIFHLPLVRTTNDALGCWARSHGVRMIGLSPEADALWTDLPRGAPIALALGDERAGLSQPLRTLCDTTVRLPILGRGDSLNVSIAAGVAMYELVRRSV